MKSLREVATFLRGSSQPTPTEEDRRKRNEAKRERDEEKARAGRLKAEKQRDRDRSRFYAEAPSFTESLSATLGSRMYFVRTGDATIGKFLFEQGWSPELDGLSKAFSALSAVGKTPAGENRIFIDVGANIGVATVTALLDYGFSEALAFEPEPRNHQLLRVNLVSNGVEGRAKALPLAVSDEPGHAELALNPANFGDHRLREHAGFHSAAGDAPLPASSSQHREGGRSADIIPVEATSLDAFLEREGIALPDAGLLWIDTQGHEARVLRGARGVLELGYPVVIEFDPWLLGDDLPDLERLISSEWTHVIDIGEKSPADSFDPIPSSDIGQVTAACREQHWHTDLVLLRL